MQRGIHARFESIYVGAHIKLVDVTSRMDTVARVLPDFRSAIIEYLRTSAAEVERLYQIDKAHPFDANTTAQENKTFTVDRLAAGGLPRVESERAVRLQEKGDELTLAQGSQGIPRDSQSLPLSRRDAGAHQWRACGGRS